MAAKAYQSERSFVSSTQSRPPASSSGPSASLSSRGLAQPVPLMGVGSLQLTPESCFSTSDDDTRQVGSERGFGTELLERKRWGR